MLRPARSTSCPARARRSASSWCDHPGVDLIAFTGSRRSACHHQPGRPASRRPDHVKRVIAEMGGKNAIIVDDDADLDEAVAGVVRRPFSYAGQKCSACSRVIVLEAAYDAFVAPPRRGHAQPRRRPGGRPGHPRRPGHRRRGRGRIDDYVAKRQDGRDAAAAAEPPAGRLARRRHFVAPHIFADVAARRRDRPGGNLRTGPRRSSRPPISTKPWRSPTARATRSPAGSISRSPAHIEQARREFRVGNLVYQPRHHRRARRSPAVRRLQALRDRHQGRRPRLPAPVPRPAGRHREHPAPRLRPTRRSPARPVAARTLLLAAASHRPERPIQPRGRGPRRRKSCLARSGP